MDVSHILGIKGNRINKNKYIIKKHENLKPAVVMIFTGHISTDSFYFYFAHRYFYIYMDVALYRPFTFFSIKYICFCFNI